MPEVKTLVETIEVDFKCPDCKTGYLRPTGNVLTTFPLQYPHICNNPACSFNQTFYEVYPHITYQLTEKKLNDVVESDGQYIINFQS